ncbi:MAG: type II toxin-antitoxin system VapC family toxin [Myxococcota bacterium]
MKLVLDTSGYCLGDLGNEEALALMERADSLFLPSIVYGELYYGFRYGSRFKQNQRRLDTFIEQFDVSVIYVDLDVARKFGDIFAALRKKGTPIPTNDIWIAACCMSVGGTLLTGDAHFSRVQQIQSEFLVQQ